MEFIITTPEQLRQIINECLDSKKYLTSEDSFQQEQASEKYLYSIKELAAFLHCSTTKAQDLKNKKKIRYRQSGRKVIFVVSEILEDLKKNSK